MLTHHNKPTAQCQLRDVSESGRERPWRRKKLANRLLSQAYKSVNPDKAERLQNCASWLVFRETDGGLQKKLESAIFCKVRLCPMCAYRRSVKLAVHMDRIMKALESDGQYAYIFATFTVRNCAGDDLSATINAMMAAWSRISRAKSFKDVVLGWYRGLEVTHNVDSNSKDYDTYHPHFHCIFVVSKAYFSSRKYISHDKWVRMWAKAMRIDYAPNVDVRRVKGNTIKAVAEATKYSVKDADYILPNDWDLTVDTVRILDAALADRRLVAYGGKMKEWHRRLNLDDEIDGDLIHVQDETDLTQELDSHLVRYVWNVGYNQYFRDDDKI